MMRWVSAGFSRGERMVAVDLAGVIVANWYQPTGLPAMVTDGTFELKWQQEGSYTPIKYCIIMQYQY
jgi:hypothetical protein